MFGYMTALRDELKVRELNLYKGYYCGICKSIGRRYGQMPRLVLSYDAVLLALILDSLESDAENIRDEHCIVHHIKKNPVVSESSAIDYAADMMLITAYHKFSDDISDENSIRGKIMKLVLRPAYSKLERKYKNICEAIKLALKELHALEKEKSPSVDLTAMASAKALKVIFTGYVKDDLVNKILSEIGNNLGKWVYLVDALDDFDEDCKNGVYNPLVYRHNKKEGLEPLLYNYLSMAASSLDLLDIKKNESLIKNIFMLGMRARTDSLLADTDNTGNGESNEGSL